MGERACLLMWKNLWKVFSNMDLVAFLLFLSSPIPYSHSPPLSLSSLLPFSPLSDSAYADQKADTSGSLAAAIQRNTTTEDDS